CSRARRAGVARPRPLPRHLGRALLYAGNLPPSRQAPARARRDPLPARPARSTVRPAPPTARRRERFDPRARPRAGVSPPRRAARAQRAPATQPPVPLGRRASSSILRHAPATLLARRGAGAVERGGLSNGGTLGFPFCPLLWPKRRVAVASGGEQSPPPRQCGPAGCRSGRTGRSLASAGAGGRPVRPPPPPLSRPGGWRGEAGEASRPSRRAGGRGGAVGAGLVRGRG